MLKISQDSTGNTIGHIDPTSSIAITPVISLGALD